MNTISSGIWAFGKSSGYGEIIVLFRHYFSAKNMMKNYEDLLELK